MTNGAESGFFCIYTYHFGGKFRGKHRFVAFFEVSQGHCADDVVGPEESPVGAGHLHLRVGPVDVLDDLAPFDADVFFLNF